MPVRKKLGDLLIEAGAIDDLQLKAALSHQRQWGGRVGRILVEMRFVGEQQICDAVAKQLGFPSVRLLGRTVDPALLKLVPQELCEKHWVFPLAIVPGERGADRLRVAMSDPTNLGIVDELRFRTGKHIEVAVAPDSQIDAAIRRHFYGESVADQRPKYGVPNNDVQFGGQEVFLTEDGDAHAAFGAPPSPAPAPAADPLGELFGPPADGGRDELDALLGIGDPAVAAAGPAALDSARRALFAAVGGLHGEPEELAAPFPASAWAGAAATPPPAAPPAWPASPSLAPVPRPPEAAALPPAAAPGDEPFGEPEYLEEVEVGLDEAPLVVGTLIAPEEAAPSPSRDELELDPGVPEPIDPEDPLDPLADEASLVATLESMAAGHEEPIEPARLVAALAMALLRKGAVRAADLLEELRR